jgi:hypothetical protein
MGKLWVDPTDLRTAAQRIRASAGVLSEIDCPRLDPDELPGSAVGGIVAPAMIADGLAGIAAQLHAWAAAAQTSATDFEAAETRSADRLDRR